jgi:hypothetical protein
MNKPEQSDGKSESDHIPIIFCSSVFSGYSEKDEQDAVSNGVRLSILVGVFRAVDRLDVLATKWARPLGRENAPCFGCRQCLSAGVFYG